MTTTASREIMAGILPASLETGNYAVVDVVADAFMARRPSIRTLGSAHQKLLQIKRDLKDVVLAHLAARRPDRLASFFGEVDSLRVEHAPLPLDASLLTQVGKAERAQDECREAMLASMDRETLKRWISKLSFEVTEKQEALAAGRARLREMECR